MDSIAEALDHIRKLPLLTARRTARLLTVDPLALKAGLPGEQPEGAVQAVSAAASRTMPASTCAPIVISSKLR